MPVAGLARGEARFDRPPPAPTAPKEAYLHWASPGMVWASMEEAIAVFKRGGFVMVMDSEDREDECDLVWSAEHVTAEQMAFGIRHTTGIVCCVGDRERLEHFGLHPATNKNTDANSTNFYVSTDFLPGTSTGVSAADRAATARALCDLSHPPESFSKPGHLFPLCARPGGVLERPGHTESTFDLCRLSGLTPVGLLAELMHDDGMMYRREDSLAFARLHRIPIITVEQIIAFRQKHPFTAAPVLQSQALRESKEELMVQTVAAAAAARPTGPAVPGVGEEASPRSHLQASPHSRL